MVGSNRDKHHQAYFACRHRRDDGDSALKSNCLHTPQVRLQFEAREISSTPQWFRSGKQATFAEKDFSHCWKQKFWVYVSLSGSLATFLVNSRPVCRYLPSIKGIRIIVSVSSLITDIVYSMKEIKSELDVSSILILALFLLCRSDESSNMIPQQAFVTTREYFDLARFTNA